MTPPSHVERTDAQPIPRVKLPRGGLTGSAIAVIAVAAAIGLFLLLNERRQSMTAGLIGKSGDAGTISSPADLKVPPLEGVQAPRLYTPYASNTERGLAIDRRDAGAQPLPQPPSVPVRNREDRIAGPSNIPAQPAYRDATTYFPRASPVGEPGPPPPLPEIERSDPQHALIIDRGLRRQTGRAARGASSGGGNERAFTTLKPEPSNSGPGLLSAGTMIPAVLETALNSSRPGVARALITRDMRGSDGKEILVPRGARVIGQYGADAAPGQNRVLITWERLVLPDGRQVKIAAPATDRDGASGLKGRVHDNVLERFLSSILRSALDIATFRAINGSRRDSIVVAVPNGLQGAGRELLPTQQYQRRITVPAGAKLSVFVNQDIDLSNSTSASSGGLR